MATSFLISAAGLFAIGAFLTALHTVTASDPRSPEQKARDIARFTREGW